MDGLTKINFETPQVPSSSSTNPKSNSTFRQIPNSNLSNLSFSEKLKKLLRNRKFQVGFLLTVLFLVFIILSVGVPAVKTYNSAKATYAQAKITQDAIKQQNVDLASSELAKT